MVLSSLRRDRDCLCPPSSCWWGPRSWPRRTSRTRRPRGSTPSPPACRASSSTPRQRGAGSSSSRPIPRTPAWPTPTTTSAPASSTTSKPAEAAKTFRTLIEKFPKLRVAATPPSSTSGWPCTTSAWRRRRPTTCERRPAPSPRCRPASRKASASAPALYYQGECLYRAGDLPGARRPLPQGDRGPPRQRRAARRLLRPGHRAAGAGPGQGGGGDVPGVPRQVPRGQAGRRVPAAAGACPCSSRSDYAEAAKLFEQSAALPDFPLADFALMQQAQLRLRAEATRPGGGPLRGAAEEVPRQPARRAGLARGRQVLVSGQRLARAETALARRR